MREARQVPQRLPIIIFSREIATIFERHEPSWDPHSRTAASLGGGSGTSPVPPAERWAARRWRPHTRPRGWRGWLGARAPCRAPRRAPCTHGRGRGRAADPAMCLAASLAATVSTCCAAWLLPGASDTAASRPSVASSGGVAAFRPPDGRAQPRGTRAAGRRQLASTAAMALARCWGLPHWVWLRDVFLRMEERALPKSVSGSGSFGPINVLDGRMLAVSSSATLSASALAVSCGSIEGAGLLAEPATLNTATLIAAKSSDQLVLSDNLAGNGPLTKLARERSYCRAAGVSTAR